MKEILLVTFILVGFINIQENKFSESYFVQYKNDKMQQNGYINFKDNSFTMKHFNSLPYSGTFSYDPSLIYLQRNSDSDIIITVEAKEIGKDTIKFYVHDKRSLNSYLHISVNSGVFIKIK